MEGGWCLNEVSSFRGTVDFLKRLLTGSMKSVGLRTAFGRLHSDNFTDFGSFYAMRKQHRAVSWEGVPGFFIELAIYVYPHATVRCRSVSGRPMMKLH